MIIARQKRKENVAEYILYMWQVEDMLRACKFNLDAIDKAIISQYQVADESKKEMKNWYADLIVMMHEEKIQESGHLNMTDRLVTILYDYHNILINHIKDPQYIEQYNITSSNITEFEKKLSHASSNIIETCLNGLYALLLLRLQKKTISKQTEEAMNSFSKLLAILSDRYRKLETNL